MPPLAIKYKFSVGYPNRGANADPEIFLPFHNRICIMTVIHNQASDRIKSKDKGKAVKATLMSMTESHMQSERMSKEERTRIRMHQ